MAFVSFALGLSIAALGILAIAWPESFAALLREAQAPAWLYFGAVTRVALGVSLLLSAPSSRAPETLRVLGLIFLVAGLLMPILGLEFFRSSLQFFLSLDPWAPRAWGCVALGFGLSVVYAVSPPSRPA